MGQPAVEDSCYEKSQLFGRMASYSKRMLKVLTEPDVKRIARIGGAFRDGLQRKTEELVAKLRADPTTDIGVIAAATMITPMVRKGLRQMTDAQAYDLFCELKTFMDEVYARS